jgi:hypothetical protein
VAVDGAVGAGIHSPLAAGYWLPAAGCQGRLSSRHPDNLPDRDMDEARAAAMMTESAAVLRNAGSTVCLPAWQSCLWTIPSGFRHRHRRVLRRPAADRVDILMPHGINLLVLDHAPPGLARRIALYGQLLFDEDPVSRVRWVAIRIGWRWPGDNLARVHRRRPRRVTHSPQIWLDRARQLRSL